MVRPTDISLVRLTQFAFAVRVEKT